MHVRRGLDMDRDVVGARRGEVGDVALGALDHQVDVDDRARVVDLLREGVDHQRAHADRRDEVPVHHVHVDGPRPRLQHVGHLGAEAREVGREDRGGHAVRRGAHCPGSTISCPAAATPLVSCPVPT
jgi:hypothetical protein